MAGWEGVWGMGWATGWGTVWVAAVWATASDVGPDNPKLISHIRFLDVDSVHSVL